MNITTIGTKKIKEGFVGQKMMVLPPDIKKMILKNQLIKSFYLTAIGYYPHATYHDRERKNGCGQYILLYCTEGTGTIQVQGKTIILKPNTFHILPKNVPHHYCSSAEDPWSIFYVHFAGELGDYFFSQYQKSSLYEIPYDEERIALFKKIFTMLEYSFEQRNLEICHVKLLDFISTFIYLKEINPSVKHNNTMYRSIEYMKHNLEKNLTAEYFARQQSLSLSHYSRLFKDQTGCSPIHYFNQLKIQKSCQFLYFTERNIKEICAELGFEDPYYFSRLFKKFMGMSPANYRNQHKKN